MFSKSLLCEWCLLRLHIILLPLTVFECLWWIPHCPLSRLVPDCASEFSRSSGVFYVFIRQELSSVSSQEVFNLSFFFSDCTVQLEYCMHGIHSQTYALFGCHYPGQFEWYRQCDLYLTCLRELFLIWPTAPPPPNHSLHQSNSLWKLRFMRLRSKWTDMVYSWCGTACRPMQAVPILDCNTGLPPLVSFAGVRHGEVTGLDNDIVSGTPSLSAQHLWLPWLAPLLLPSSYSPGWHYQCLCSISMTRHLNTLPPRHHSLHLPITTAFPLPAKDYIPPWALHCWHLHFWERWQMQTDHTSNLKSIFCWAGFSVVLQCWLQPTHRAHANKFDFIFKTMFTISPCVNTVEDGKSDRIICVHMIIIMSYRSCHLYVVI